jgi:H+/Cl- antiporter ClcA
MKLIYVLLIFHRKLFLPAMLISLLIALLGLGISGSFSLGLLGFSYLFLAVLCQYFIYELNNPNEYYFYYNLGLSKPILYVSTVVIGLLIGLIGSMI